MIKIAIQNIHLAPNIFDIGIHDYILEFIKNGYAPYIYFEGLSFREKISITNSLIRGNHSKISFKEIEPIFNINELNSKCDVLLNFNTYTKDHDFTKNIKKFNGLKIWHVGDYFWNEPASNINKRFENFGIDYLFGYSSHDKYCKYFQKTFPKYIDRVLPIPFGYQKRFTEIKSFKNRINKCIALGSVNPLRPLNYPVNNYIESANFFPDEQWFHKFRRKIVLNKNYLGGEIDSMLPEFPKIKNFDYDLVEKLNNYKMFTSCESIFNFPPAKTFEGIASGSVLICSDLECNKEYGFVDGINCVMYKKHNITDFRKKIRYYQSHEKELINIKINGKKHVTKNFNHASISKNMYKQIENTWNKKS